jgi:hypothetical protein
LFVAAKQNQPRAQERHSSRGRADRNGGLLRFCKNSDPFKRLLSNSQATWQPQILTTEVKHTQFCVIWPPQSVRVCELINIDGLGETTLIGSREPTPDFALRGLVMGEETTGKTIDRTHRF